MQQIVNLDARLLLTFLPTQACKVSIVAQLWCLYMQWPADYKNERIPRDYTELVDECTKFIPAERPSMDEVVSVLETIRASV